MLAEQALHYIQLLSEIEREARDLESDSRPNTAGKNRSGDGKAAYLDDRPARSRDQRSGHQQNA